VAGKMKVFQVEGVVPCLIDVKEVNLSRMAGALRLVSVSRCRPYLPLLARISF
jgi:hypothetical protein